MTNGATPPATVPPLSSFTEDGPWEVDMDRLSWRCGLDRVRADAHARVPDLMRSRRLPPAGRLLGTGIHLSRAVGGWSLFERRKGSPYSAAGLSRRLRRAFEKLGPTYIKLGQVISSGEGVLPDELVAEFRGLRDRVPAEPFEVVRAVVESEFGRPLSQIFAHFDGEPAAAASIAQVHMATLLTGEEVAVKVQRPGIGRLVEQDLSVMAALAPVLAKHIDVLKIMNFPALIELFAETVVEELDFRLEAENMLDIAMVLDKTAQRAILVPRPHPDLVTRRVLVMERLDGFAFDDVAGMRAAGVDTAAVIRACLVSVLEGAMIYGVFHGDLHGGNLMVHPDGRVVLLDYGITGRLTNRRRLIFLNMLMSAIAGNHRGVLQGYQDLGAIPPETDLDVFMEEIPVDRPGIDPSTADADQMISEMRRVTKALVRHGLRVPKELMLFMKDFMFIDGAMTTLAPDLDVVAEMMHLAQYFVQFHGEQIAQDIGLDPSSITLDSSAWLNSLGLDPEAGSITHREILEQREEVRAKMAAHRRRR